MKRLFTYFLTFFVRPKKPLERYDVYRPEERYIYHYWDGSRMVAADPLELYKRVSGIGTELSIDMKVAQSESKASKDAHASMLDKIRAIFDIAPPVSPIDCTGTLSQIELVDLFDHFMLFAEGVKKNSRKSPTSFTAILPPSKPSSNASQAISSSSGSGSTGEGPSTDGPARSPMGPPLPSDR